MMLKFKDLKNNLKDIATYLKDKTHIKIDYNERQQALNSNV